MKIIKRGDDQYIQCPDCGILRKVENVKIKCVVCETKKMKQEIKQGYIDEKKRREAKKRRRETKEAKTTIFDNIFKNLKRYGHKKKRE